MTKQEIVSAVAEAADINKSQAEKALGSVLSSISESLSKGNSVSFAGFGAFNVKRRAARAGRNPQTGAVIQIAAANAVSFKPSSVLKKMVNS